MKGWNFITCVLCSLVFMALLFSPSIWRFHQAKRFKRTARSRIGITNLFRLQTFGLPEEGSIKASKLGGRLKLLTSAPLVFPPHLTHLWRETGSREGGRAEFLKKFHHLFLWTPFRITLSRESQAERLSICLDGFIFHPVIAQEELPFVCLYHYFVIYVMLHFKWAKRPVNCKDGSSSKRGDVVILPEGVVKSWRICAKHTW